jgi:hypothetical protein
MEGKIFDESRDRELRSVFAAEAQVGQTPDVRTW